MFSGRRNKALVRKNSSAASKVPSRSRVLRNKNKAISQIGQKKNLATFFRQFTLPSVIAALWGISIYAYDNVWKNYFIAEQLSISTKSVATPLCNGLMGVQIDLTITNNGTDPIFQALNGITIYGLKISKRQAIDEDEFGALVVAAINRDGSIATYLRHAVISSPQLISFASFLTPAYEFEPKQTITLQKFFAVPLDLDYLEVNVEILHTTKPLHAKPKYSYREEKRIGMDLTSPSIENLRRSSTIAAIPLITEKIKEVRLKQDCGSKSIQVTARPK